MFIKVSEVHQTLVGRVLYTIVLIFMRLRKVVLKQDVIPSQ